MSVFQSNRMVTNAGIVKGVGVGVYWNMACTNQTSSINWGLLDPGSSKSVVIYIRNEGNTLITLSKTTKWYPSAASSYMSLTWNYTGNSIAQKKVLPVQLKLAISSSITGITNFSFNITITGMG